jgi:hypothetical protein
MVVAPLVCPACAAVHSVDERFCRACGTPLVIDPESVEVRPLSPAAERARKIRPGYTEGELVRVARARHQAEAELVQGLLLEEGIPSLVRRSGGFDVPDFLASGPRDVLVPASGADAARDVLGTPPPASARPTRRAAPAWVRAMALVLAAFVIGVVALGLYLAITA